MSSSTQSSGNTINYYARPCKGIERKMMCEFISCYESICPGKDYRYIGMGAKYYADFVLFHKMFGFEEMISLEKRANERERLEFNKPFNCISLKLMDATSFFTSTATSWNEKKNVIWLDYDGGLTGRQVQDVGLCVGKVEDISLVFVSTNINMGDNFEKGLPEDKLGIFTERINKESLTKHLNIKSFAGAGKYKAVSDVFNNEIEEILVNKNNDCSPIDKFCAEQIAYFRYSDSSAEMITLGWIVFQEKDRDAVKNSGISNLPFYVGDDKKYDISVDLYTYKELAVLNKNLPNIQYPVEDAPFFEQDEVERYERVYRYYPTIMETNITL